MRFLILISLLFTTHLAFAEIDLESQNLIDPGISNGLGEVNEKGAWIISVAAAIGSFDHNYVESPEREKF